MFFVTTTQVKRVLAASLEPLGMSHDCHGPSLSPEVTTFLTSIVIAPLPFCMVLSPACAYLATVV